MNRQFTWKATTILAVILIAVYSLATFGIKLGLDLKGGTQFLLKMDMSKVNIEDRAQALHQAIEVIRKRIDRFGVAEPVIQPEGLDRMVVQMPGLEQSHREEARHTLERTAFLEFRLVHPNNEDLVSQAQSDPNFAPPVGYQKLILKENRLGRPVEQVYFVKIRSDLTGKHVKAAYPSMDATSGTPSVIVDFDSEGAKVFGRLTTANVGRQLSIVLDGELYSAPRINEPITEGHCTITGSFTPAEAQQLANVLENPLEAPVKIIEERGVDPSLGRDSIHSGIRAAVVGSVAVVVFMAVYYLAAGLVADAALLFNILITLGVLAMFKFTLTLPGIAGIVLTIGMAVDSNVLIYERVREELAANKPLRAAIAAAYTRAFRVIFDAHFTAILTALILISMGSGSVKGFGVTLAIGLLANLFSGVFGTRLVFDWAVAKGWLKSFPMLHVFRRLPHINFLGVWKLAFIGSWLIIITGMVSFVRRGGLDLGQKTVVQLSSGQQIGEGELRNSLEAAGIPHVALTTGSGKDSAMTVTLRLPSNNAEAAVKQLQTAFTNAQFKVTNTQQVMGEVYGIDFKGGENATLAFTKRINPDEIRHSLEQAGFTEAYIQYEREMTGGKEVLALKLPEGQTEKVISHLQQSFPDARFKTLSTDRVGAVVGKELLKQALWATAVSLIAIMVYLAFRFGEFSYGLGGLVSLIHDVLMTIGVFCLSGRTFSMPVVAAVLTLIGYSINDTIVVFDRIRENKKLTGGRFTYFDLINRSVNETLARTILTAGTVFLCAVALYGFGGRVLNDFAFCFVIGVLTGTYSSIYIASPCVLWYHRNEAARGGQASVKKTATAKA